MRATARSSQTVAVMAARDRAMGRAALRVATRASIEIGTAGPQYGYVEWKFTAANSPKISFAARSYAKAASSSVSNVPRKIRGPLLRILASQGLPRLLAHTPRYLDRPRADFW